MTDPLKKFYERATNKKFKMFILSLINRRKTQNGVLNILSDKKINNSLVIQQYVQRIMMNSETYRKSFYSLTSSINAHYKLTTIYIHLNRILNVRRRNFYKVLHETFINDFINKNPDLPAQLFELSKRTDNLTVISNNLDELLKTRLFVVSFFIETGPNSSKYNPISTVRFKNLKDILN